MISEVEQLMIKRIMIFGILASLIQVMNYYFLIFILWNVGKFFHTPTKTGFTWGLTILYSTYIFGITTIIQNSLIEILYKKNIRIYLFFGALITFTLAVENFNFWPIKTLILTISGLVTLSIKFYLDHKIDKSKIINR
ncbi:hypothetical protein E0I61_15975 [Flavobacterium ranwuense]|uniref:GtrA-like protein domain-containing protein n=1 Tax=Flavobacterium ranwuense TaxID=2541725 RepID=A0ABY2DPQ6_9FLAO|nr:hypothetical protein [Flavobacterium ranwuense]TDE26858.1 hypothetical protein E0I61_15975 [Flavobacterium ranwuense]